MADDLKGALNESQPNTTADKLGLALLGDVIANTQRQLLNATVASNRLVLPNNAKAFSVQSLFAVTGGVTGYLTLVGDGPGNGGVPAAGQFVVAANGDLVFAAADAITAVDVVYTSPDADVEEFESVQVAASALVLPSGKRAWLLVEVEILTGIDLQTMNGADINERGSAPADNTVNIDDAGTGIDFNAADVVAGTARVVALVAREQNLTTKLDLDPI